MSELLTMSWSVLQYMLLLSGQMLLVLIARKPVSRYFGAVNAYRLWLLPLLWSPCYWIDFSFIDWSAVAGLWAEEGKVHAVVSWMLVSPQTLDFALSEMMPSLDPANEQSSVLLWQGIIGVWLLIAVLLLSLQLLSISNFSRMLVTLGRQQTAGDRDAEAALPRRLAKVPVLILPGLSSPAVFGVFKPCLLLPEAFNTQHASRQRELILTHEAVHMQRHDNFWNLLATLLRLLFWFNPLMHLAWRYFRLDQELSCDEIALQQTNPDEGKLYARTLLESMHSTVKLQHQPTITAWGNLQDIKERTNMIRYHLKHKPRSGVGKGLLAFCLLAGGMSTALLSQQFNAVIAAETDVAPIESQKRETLGRNVYRKIERLQEAKAGEDFETIESMLEDLRLLEAADKLNGREQSVYWLFAAEYALSRQRYEQALGFANRVLSANASIKSDIETSLLLIGRIHAANGDYAQAVTTIQEYLQKNAGRNPAALLVLAYTHYQLGELDEAYQVANEIVEASPRNLSANALMLLTLKQAGRKAAAQELEKAIEERFAEAAQQSFISAIQGIKPGELSYSELMMAPRAEYLPIVIVPAQYPDKALQGGIEGWAQVSFTVGVNGEVVDPKVVDANPEGVFDESSLKAVRQFKFNPRMQNGEAVAVDGVQYVFRYNLAED